jgi:hypothetical protein
VAAFGAGGGRQTDGSVVRIAGRAGAL